MCVHRVLEHALRLCRASLAIRKKKKRKEAASERAQRDDDEESCVFRSRDIPQGTLATGPRHRARLRNEFRNEISAGASFNAGIK